MVTTRTFEIRTPGRQELIDISGQVERLVRSGGMAEGTATVFIPGCSVALISLECPGNDWSAVLQQFQPVWEMPLPIAAKVSMLGTSLLIPFQRSHLLLSTWQRLVLVDMGQGEQWHHVTVQLLGDAG